MLPLLLSLALLAADPPAAKLAIVGPAEVAEYRLVRLAAAGVPDGAALIWDVSDEDAVDVEETAGGVVLTGPAGTYRVKLRAIVAGAKPTVLTARLTLTIRGKAAPQPPQPNPGPAPLPTPGPATPVRLKAVAVYESEAASLAAGTFFADKAVRGRWAERGHLPPVLVDKDVRDPETLAAPAKLKPFIDRAANKALPQLYLVNADTGDVLFEGPIPETPAALLALLPKIGG